MPSSTRVALITGCGKPIGIGNSTARALAKAGATVVVSDVVPTGVANEHNVEGDLDPSWDGVESLVQEIVRNGGSASSTLGDVSVEADAARMVEEVLRRYGRLDILVNNAGAPQGADRNEIENVPVEAWDRTMGVNVRGAFLMSRAAVPAMRKASWGRIVSVSSKAAFRPGKRRATYAASKAAIVGFTKSLAFDLAPFGNHRQRRLPRPDPYLASHQHQPPGIRRGFGGRVRRTGKGHSSWPLRESRRGRRDDCLPRFGRGCLCDRPGNRYRWRLVR